MQRVRTTQVRNNIGESITICGWIHALRRVGKVAFVVVRDGWGTVQVVATPARLEPLDAVGAGLESVVRVRGRVVANVSAPGGAELVEPAFEVISAVCEPRPVPGGPALSRASLPALLDHAPTVLRDPSRRAVFDVAGLAMAGFRAALGRRGFREIQTPKIVAGATESGANVFGLDYFGREAFLAQSPQLYKQIMVGVFERVFEVGPVFRAEPHATVRHLAEYVSLDAELGFIEDHHDVVAILRASLKGMLGTIADEGTAAARLGLVVPALPDPLPWIDFSEARGLLAAAGVGPVESTDLAPAEERWLSAWAQREHASEWLVVTGYPMAKRPFYTYPAPGRAEASNSFDLLFRGTELVTGGQRQHVHADLVAAMARASVPREGLEGYLEAFRHGMPPHGGFAIGLERFVSHLVGFDNIRLATLFPRDVRRTSP